MRWVRNTIKSLSSFWSQLTHWVASLCWLVFFLLFVFLKLPTSRDFGHFLTLARAGDWESIPHFATIISKFFIWGKLILIFIAVVVNAYLPWDQQIDVALIVADWTGYYLVCLMTTW